MVRTQIQLTEKQWKFLKQLAHKRGVSIAELIRQSVDELAGKQDPVPVDPIERRRRALAVVGRYQSGLEDVSVNHDEYLTEDYRA